MKRFAPPPFVPSAEDIAYVRKYPGAGDTMPDTPKVRAFAWIAPIDNARIRDILTHPNRLFFGGKTRGSLLARIINMGLAPMEAEANRWSRKR